MPLCLFCVGVAAFTTMVVWLLNAAAVVRVLTGSGIR